MKVWSCSRFVMRQGLAHYHAILSRGRVDTRRKTIRFLGKRVLFEELLTPSMGTSKAVCLRNGTESARVKRKRVLGHAKKNLGIMENRWSHVHSVFTISLLFMWAISTRLLSDVNNTEICVITTRGWIRGIENQNVANSAPCLRAQELARCWIAQRTRYMQAL